MLTHQLQKLLTNTKLISDITLMNSFEKHTLNQDLLGCKSDFPQLPHPAAVEFLGENRRVVFVNLRV